MASDKMTEQEVNDLFEELFKKNYYGLLRFANITLNNHGGRYVSVSGRSEEAVQELFAFAWERREDLLKSKSMVGWLYEALHYKVLEMLNQDRLWTKRLLQVSEGITGVAGPSFQLKAELSDLLPTKDYELLRKLYLEGYTYDELCKEYGIKRSTLAMRVKRIKDRFIEQYEKDDK